MQAGLREQAAVRSVSRLDPTLARDAVVDRLARHVGERVEADLATLDELFRDTCRLKGIDPRPPLPTADDTRAASLVPRRRLYGPLRAAYFNEHLSPARRDWYAEGHLTTLQREEVLNFIDGKRTVRAITDAVAAELGTVAVADVLRYLEDVASLGFVEGINASPAARAQCRGIRPTSAALLVVLMLALRVGARTAPARIRRISRDWPRAAPGCGGVARPTDGNAGRRLRSHHGGRGIRARGTGAGRRRGHVSASLHVSLLSDRRTRPAGRRGAARG